MPFTLTWRISPASYHPGNTNRMQCYPMQVTAYPTSNDFWDVFILFFYFLFIYLFIFFFSIKSVHGVWCCLSVCWKPPPPLPSVYKIRILANITIVFISHIEEEYWLGITLHTDPYRHVVFTLLQVCYIDTYILVNLYIYDVFLCLVLCT